MHYKVFVKMVAGRLVDVDRKALDCPVVCSVHWRNLLDLELWLRWRRIRVPHGRLFDPLGYGRLCNIQGLDQIVAVQISVDKQKGKIY